MVKHDVFMIRGNWSAAEITRDQLRIYIGRAKVLTTFGIESLRMRARRMAIRNGDTIDIEYGMHGAVREVMCNEQLLCNIGLSKSETGLGNLLMNAYILAYLDSGCT